MDESFLTNREIATLVLAGLALGFLTLRARKQNGIRESLNNVVSSFLQPKVLIPLLLYVVWVTVLLVPAQRIGVWGTDLWKPTVLWLVGTGFGLIFNLTDAVDDPTFLRHRTLRAISIAAILEYVSNLASFALWIEIPAQILAVLFAGVALLDSHPKYAAARKLANTYLGVLGLSAIVWTALRLASEWQDIDHWALLREFLLPIWLTPPALAYVYLLAVWAAYTRVFSQMRFTADGGSLISQRLAVVLRTAARRSALRALLPRSWHLGQAGGFGEAWHQTGNIIGEERARVAARIAEQRRLVENAGLAGTDDSGKQLDQREHKDTMGALRTLANWQFGHYNNRGGKYRKDLAVDFLAEKHGLPTSSDIRIRVNFNGQRWYAERRTITGHWFAIGAAAPPTDQWVYDGPEPPTGYPNESEWDQWYGHTNALNWD